MVGETDGEKEGEKPERRKRRENNTGQRYRIDKKHCCAAMHVKSFCVVLFFQEHNKISGDRIPINSGSAKGNLADQQHFG